MTSPLQQQLPSPQLTAATTQLLLLLLLLPILSLLYSLAVHIFLSSFNERKLLKFHHWRPILIRVVFCSVCATFWWFTTSSVDISSGHYIDDDQDNATIITKLFVALIVAAVAIKLIIQTRQFEINGPPPPPKPTQNSSTSNNSNNSSKVILITGANSGIGLETTKLLYHQYHATVILACRSRVRAMEAMEWIDPSCNRRKNEVRCNNNISSGTIISPPGKRIHFLPLDLTSISSIHTAFNILLKEMKISKLHVLINNAGVMMNERRVTVDDGLEMTMAANHLGHFLLTNLLLPKLRETAMIEKHPTKVITVSSSLYTNAVRPIRNNNNNINEKEQATKWSNTEPGIDLQDLQCQHKPYRLFEQYAQSKLANILFARELARREKLISGGNGGGLVQSHVLHPGLVRTNVTRNMPWYLYYPNLIFSLFMMMLQKSPKCGAYTTVYCAMMDQEETGKDDEKDESCHYYVNSQRQSLEKLALSEEEGRKLWKLSCQLMSLPLDKES